jgi:hypothetical protein
VSKGWYSLSKIVIVIPDKLFYVCWYSLKDANPLISDPYRSCNVIDLFTIDDSKMKTNNSLEVVNYINQTIIFHSRQYGPFSSLNFDFSATGELTRMLAFPVYNSAAQKAASEKIMTIYDLSKPSYSVLVYMKNGLYKDKKTKSFAFGDNSNQTNISLSKPIDMEISLQSYEKPENNGYIPLYFANNSYIMHLVALNNKVVGPEPKFACAITPNSATYESCSTAQLCRYQLAYTPNPEDESVFYSRIVLFENRYFEFISYKDTAIPFNRIRMGYYDISYGTNADGSQFQAIINRMNYTLKEFVGDSSFSYANFTKGEQSSDGIYLYFSSVAPFHVIRFDSITGTYKVGSFDQQVRVFESISRYYIVGFENYSPANKKSTTVTLWYNSKNNGESSERDLKAKCMTTNIVLDPEYVLDNIDSIYVDYKLATAQVVIYVVSRPHEQATIKFNKLVFLKYSFTPNNAQVSEITPPQLQIKRVIDKEFVKEVYLRPKCIYQDTIMFTWINTATPGKKLSNIIVYNSTKNSFFTYTYYYTDATEMDLLCANDFADVYFRGKDDSIMFKMSSEKNAFKRIRSDTRSISMDKKYTFSDSMLTHIVKDNSFIQDLKDTTKVFLNIKMKPVALPSYSLTSPSIESLTLKITSNDSSYQTIHDVVLRPYPLNQTRPPMIPNYIGNDSINLQQKFLFIEYFNETYEIEKLYALPFDIFGIRLNDSSKESLIKINRRAMHIRKWPLNTDYSMSKGKSCGFSNFTAANTRIIDDVMLRVLRKDVGFCMELSLIQVKDSKAGFQRSQPDILIQDFGLISDCVLLKDRYIYDLDDLQQRKAREELIEYGVSCIYTENGLNYLWLLRIPIGKTVEQSIQISDNLIKIPINRTFTGYKATLVSGSFFFVLLDSGKNKFYASPRIIGKSFPYDAKLELVEKPGSIVEFSYFIPSNPLDIKESGLTIDVTTVSNSAGPNPSYLLKSYAINSNGQFIDRGFSVAFLHDITSLSCAYQTNAKGVKNMECAYMYAGSGNTIFYKPNLINDPSVADRYIPPMDDQEVKTVRTFYANGEFYILALSYSPKTGSRYLVAMKHSHNETLAKDAYPRTNFSSYPLVIFDAMDLTNTFVDVTNTEFSIFYVDSQIYMALTTGYTLEIFSLRNMSISISEKATFQDIENTAFVLYDNLNKVVATLPLTTIFRKKNPLTFMWLIILGISLGLAVVLIVLYLIFKKKNTAIEAELMAGLDFKQDFDERTDGKEIRRDTFEVETL